MAVHQVSERVTRHKLPQRSSQDRRQEDCVTEGEGREVCADYAAVSKLKLSKADRKETLRLKRLLNSNIVQPDSFPDLAMQELETAIKRMRRKGAPGEDDIPPSFLKELGPAALKELLAICNQSLRESKCPQSC